MKADRYELGAFILVSVVVVTIVVGTVLGWWHVRGWWDR